MPMNAEAVIRTWFEELWNRGQEGTIDRFLAPDAKVHGLPTPDGQPIRGPQEFKPFYRQFRATFPDIRVTVERTVTEPPIVAAHCHVTGRHTGNALAPASGNPSTPPYGRVITSPPAMVDRASTTSGSVVFGTNRTPPWAKSIGVLEWPAMANPSGVPRTGCSSMSMSSGAVHGIRVLSPAGPTAIVFDDPSEIWLNLTPSLPWKNWSGPATPA